MSSRWWPRAGESLLLGERVKVAAAQPGAQAAHGLALWDHATDGGIGVPLQDPVRHAQGRQVLRQHVLGKTGLLLVQVHRHQIEGHRRPSLKRQQHVQHGVAVLAAGQAGHHPVALLDHGEIHDRLAGLAAQPLGDLIEFVLGFARGRPHVLSSPVHGKVRIITASDCTAVLPGKDAYRWERLLQGFV